MRATPLWASLALLVGCATPPAEEPVGDAPPAQSATAASSREAAEPQVPLPRGAAIDRAFPPEAQEVLAAPDACRLLALVCEREPAPDEETIGGEFPVVASAELSAADARRVVAALWEDILAGGAIAMCFEPHHGLRARKGDHEVELAVCYTCLQVYVYLDRVHVGGAAMATDSRRLLDRLLGDAPRDRLLDGRTLAEWQELLAAAPAEAPLDATQARGVEALVGTLGWGPRARSAVLELLRRLGPRAAPALPGLQQLLRRGSPQACVAAVELLLAMGPAAAPAAPELVALLNRDPASLLERELPDEASEEEEQAAELEERLSQGELEELRVQALRTLLAAGPEALAEAKSTLKYIASWENPFEAELAREGLQLLEEFHQLHEDDEE